jgi:hypothetical protein
VLAIRVVDGVGRIVKSGYELLRSCVYRAKVGFCYTYPSVYIYIYVKYALLICVYYFIYLEFKNNVLLTSVTEQVWAGAKCGSNRCNIVLHSSEFYYAQFCVPEWSSHFRLF